MLNRIIGVISTVSLIFIILLTSVDFATFHLPFYRYQYNKNRTAENIDITDAELMYVTEILLGYMKGDYDDLFVEVYIAGEKREFFNDREKEHMVDVRNLFEIGYTVRRIALMIYLATILTVFRYKEVILKEILKCYKIGMPVFLGGLAVLAAIIFIDFDRAFTIFHEIFFFNDLWILNPRTDLLINIVPIDFFIGIFIFIISIFVFSLLFITIISHFCLKKLSK